MSRLRTIELIEPYSYFPSSPPVFLRETSIFAPKTSIFAPKTLALPSFLDELEEYELGFGLDLISPSPSPFELFDSVTDLIRVDRTPSFSSYRRIQRLERLGGDIVVQSLSDRVSELESRFDRLARIKGVAGDLKYTWTAETKIPAKNVDRKYKWTAEIKEGRKKEEDTEGSGRTYKLTAEIEGNGSDGQISRTYTFKASSGDAGDRRESKKKEKKTKKKSDKDECATRLVQIEEAADHRAVVLRQAFAKRIGAKNDKGKKKELSPQDAAMMIQISFRAYLIRRSQALRALRDLAVAKTKLKEIRGLFNNVSYRRLVARDAEERQRFSEKIIVLLLTVDAIEFEISVGGEGKGREGKGRVIRGHLGADLMVRAAKRSMVDELEAMLDVVDPQPGKSLSMRRRTFDMPDSAIQKEIAAGVAEVVQMLNHGENSSNTFEACL
ncbi:IQ motif, EF-hand binding site [Trema orientale]|uniref:IQ motif, EF-hand binding site n=1 Tax=Trema orientale TaxID=63057 RepID=A0A2P5EVC9_TREOI|nr:IQ motif, EF-hand binding site [Trema orientale]